MSTPLKAERLLDKSFSPNFSGNAKSKIAFRERACLRITRYTRALNRNFSDFSARFSFFDFVSSKSGKFHFSFKKNFSKRGYSTKVIWKSYISKASSSRIQKSPLLFLTSQEIIFLDKCFLFISCSKRAALCAKSPAFLFSLAINYRFNVHSRWVRFHGSPRRWIKLCNSLERFAESQSLVGSFFSQHSHMSKSMLSAMWCCLRHRWCAN